eukprot:462804-Rhodomonas_salina.2
MAREQEVGELGLSPHSFSAQPRASAQQHITLRRRVVCGAALLVFAALVVALTSDSAPSSAIELTDQNQYESEPAFDADWNQQITQQHFVRFQRRQTSINKKRDEEVKRLDAD